MHSIAIGIYLFEKNIKDINLTTAIHSLDSDYSIPFRSFKPFLQRQRPASV